MSESKRALRRYGALFVLGTFLGGCAEERVQPAPNGTPPPILDARGRVPDLHCPGDPGCEDATGPISVGAAARPITPVVETWVDSDGSGDQNGDEPFVDGNGNGAWDPVWIAGFGMGRAATGVHDDMWTRVVVLEKGDVSIALVSLDLVGFFHDDAVRVRLVAAEAGLAFDHIVVSSTHTHEGPDTIGIWGRSVAASGYDDAYIRETVIANTVDALTEAFASRRPAEARIAVTSAPELIKDTRQPEIIDQALTVVHFGAVETSGSIATLTFWGNHPESLGSENTRLSSDYPHFVREEMEARYPGALALFFNGSLGGLSTPIGIIGCPSPDGVETCPQGTVGRAEYIGRSAAHAASEALENDAVVVGADKLDLGVQRRSFVMTTTNTALAFAVWLGLIPRRVYWADSGIGLTSEEFEALSVADLSAQTVGVQTEVNLLQIGPLAIATAPGELYPELWLVKPGGGTYIERPVGADFPDAPLETPIQAHLPTGAVRVIVNNGNDALGYILPMSQWDALAPYAYVDGDGPQYGEENSLGAAAGTTINAEFEAMLE